MPYTKNDNRKQNENDTNIAILNMNTHRYKLKYLNTLYKGSFIINIRLRYQEKLFI